MTRKKQSFNERVDVIKPKLPPYYGIRLQSKGYDIDNAILYDVVGKRTINERYLKILEEEFGGDKNNLEK